MALRPASWLLAGAAVLSALAGWEAWQLMRLERWNSSISAGKARAQEAGEPALLRFASAHVLAERGDVQDALNEYRELATSGSGQLRRDAAFNSGNLYLSLATASRPGSDASAALALAELAKQSYRDVLKEDSNDWDARYNLERALKVAPDPQADSDAMSTPPSRLHTATTGRGTSLGLP